MYAHEVSICLAEKPIPAGCAFILAQRHRIKFADSFALLCCYLRKVQADIASDMLLGIATCFGALRV